MKTFRKAGQRKEAWLHFGYCLLIAVGCLLICSKSSPLYPLNDWADANIYFSMGKGMAHGRVLYRDLYDHKGPLLYGLYALCALLSPRSFLSVWIMEVFAAAFFLYSVLRTLALFGIRRSAFAALPILAMLVYSSVSFQQGGSAEELCLPLWGWSLYAWLRQARQTGAPPMKRGTLLLHGALCGCVLWIKFTMLGFYAPWLLLALLPALRGQWKAALRGFAWFMAGIGLATIPWLLYFGANHAVLPWLKSYLYDNLFLYSAGEGSGVPAQVKAMVKSALEWFGRNLPYTLLLLLGLGWGVTGKAAKRREGVSLWLLFITSALGVFIGGKSYLYYGFILAAFAGLGLIPLCLMGEKRFSRPGARGGRLAALTALSLVVSLAGCYALSPNVRTSFRRPRESLMQYQLAAVIAETPDATLLNYGFMDAGFYTAAGIVPHVKYFHQTNVPLQEMLDEQTRYIREGLSDYVVTRGRQPDGILETYDLVAQAQAPEDFWYATAYLYRLKTLVPADRTE